MGALRISGFVAAGCLFVAAAGATYWYTAGGPVATPVAVSTPAPALALPAQPASGLATGAPVGPGPAISADLSQQPMPGPVEPETAAATLKIPDGVASDRLWQVGSTYFSAKRFPEASAYFWKSASSGDARGAAALGSLYVRGEGVVRDVAIGVFWLNKAANAGNRGAQFVLGGLYHEGISVPQDDAKAATLYLDSAQQGFVPAMKAIALAYEFGRGVPRDRQQAIYWMQKAAVAGDREAQVLVAVLTDQRTPPMSDEKALQIFITSNPNFTLTNIASANPPAPVQQPPVQQQPAQQQRQAVAQADPNAVAPVQRQRPQGRQPSAQDIRQAQAVMGLMRQSMGFGGIFGGVINSSVGPSTWGSSGNNGCGQYTEYAACQAHKNGDEWAADRIENHEADGAEKDWYDQ